MHSTPPVALCPRPIRPVKPWPSTCAQPIEALEIEIEIDFASVMLSPSASAVYAERLRRLARETQRLHERALAALVGVGE